MPWELHIHQLDVGYGESTFIVATDSTDGSTRTMLIDGGTAEHAQIVHSYIKRVYQGTRIDRIVTTHYDIDHSNGIRDLLVTDNRYRIAHCVGLAAGDAASDAAKLNSNWASSIAAGAAAAVAAASGAYWLSNEKNYSSVAKAAAKRARKKATPAKTIEQAAHVGYEVGLDLVRRTPKLNPAIIKSALLKEICTEAGFAAQNVSEYKARIANATAEIQTRLLRTGAETTRFDTGGLYGFCQVVDIGDSDGEAPAKDSYIRAARGIYSFNSNNEVPAPHLRRTRRTPALGEEILWNDGTNTFHKAPNGAPAVFVVAINRMVLGFPRADVGGDPTNRVSIGLAIRFNDFFFYTGGDLTIDGEDLVADSLRRWGLPNPQDPTAAFPRVKSICSFKCGHHGASTSNSKDFIDRLNARAAFISCGGKHQHPAQKVVDRLQNNQSILKFYLTNIQYPRNHIPMSTGQDQFTVPGNKAFVAGDNASPNTAEGRRRGNIEIVVDERSAATGVFQVRYWSGAGARSPVVDFITFDAQPH